MTLRISVIATILAIPLVSSLLPIRIPSVSSESCASLDEQFDQTGILKNEVNAALLKLHGPPCTCGITEQWSRIAYLNMSDTTQQCPTNWTLSAQVRGCGRKTQGRFSCDSVFYPANKTYTRVCGRVNAYQAGATDAFDSYISVGQTTLDSAYIDGISVTHGIPGNRVHIWSFVVALYEEDPNYQPTYNCPCINNKIQWPYQEPPFVNKSYYCGAGNTGPGYNTDGQVYPNNDVLWDGEGCGPHNECCQFNHPPWFCIALPQPTSDDLELRLCMGEDHEEDAIVTLVDIYVQ